MDYKFQQKTLQILLDKMEEGVHIIDKEGMTLAYNKAMEAIEGLIPDEVIGKHFGKVFPRLYEGKSTLLSAIEQGQTVRNYRQDYTNFRGEKISSINNTYPIIIDGEVAGAIEISSNVSDMRELSSQLEKLEHRELQPHRPNYYTFSDIIGQSPLMREALRLAAKSAQSDATVLIVGDTGTGKELFAQSIHNHSRRQHGPFIALNCGSLPETLLESLLFGTVKGAFTGATDSRGLFEQAHKGTLFLDEINSMSLNLQSKLLRVLQENFIRKLGDERSFYVDVRIIAATNQNPYRQMQEGRLREDLYYRLNILRVDLPPLHQRPGDIPLLVNRFLQRASAKAAREIHEVDGKLMEALESKHYRGNVRELENLIESAVNLKEGEGSVLELSDMPSHFFVNMDDQVMALELNGEPLDQYLAQIESSLIRATFYREGRNVSQTAKKLGLPRQNLQYKLKKYRII